MRRSNIAIVCALVAVVSVAQAQEQTAERVRIREDGRVSFVPPAGFKPMSKEAIEFKFGSNDAAYAPGVAYSNERQNVSVAVGFAGNGLRAEQLDEVKKVFEARFERDVPGVEWIERELITRDGRRWFRLHFKAAIDTGVVNDMYATIFDGQLLVFNFNSTIAQYENYKESLRRSAQTIIVK